jgi:hypothetical protein
VTAVAIDPEGEPPVESGAAESAGSGHAPATAARLGEAFAVQTVWNTVDGGNSAVAPTGS